LGVAVQGYLFLSHEIPSIEKLKSYEFPIPTQVFADNGEVIGEFCYQRRYVISLKEMPKALQDAVVAAEGPELWKPRGLGTKAIVNAVLKIMTRRAIASGVRPWPLSRPDLTGKGGPLYKLKMSLLCNRIEKALTKEERLYFCMNQIYLGRRAYGVEAAARTYFGKSAMNLTVAECATIAGLAKAPSKYSRKRNVEAALERRNYVLARMYEDGKLAQAEYEKATREQLVLGEKKAPYEKKVADFLEHVRRHIESKYGKDALYKGGLRVHTSAHLPVTDAAQEAIPAPNVYIRKILDRRGKVLEEHVP